MTNKQVFVLITSEPKWYAPYMSAQLASMFKRNFINGTMKDATIKRWFAKFGYEQEEVKWKRKS